jgi:hypothetical protein
MLISVKLDFNLSPTGRIHYGPAAAIAVHYIPRKYPPLN